jgi:hypothetical protein
VGWKKGFLNPQARALLGQVAVVDIGAPIELYRRYGERRHDGA